MTSSRSEPFDSIIATCGKVTRAAWDLNNLMRSLFEQHVEWTRMTIISIVAEQPDEGPVTRRLLRNASDLADVLRPLYGNQVAAQVNRLITDHLVIAAQLVKAAKAGDAAGAADAEARWYANGDDIAATLAAIIPYWSRATLAQMRRRHLELTKAEAVARINGDYESGIALHDEIERQALIMADEFTRGITLQFPEVFCGR